MHPTGLLLEGAVGNFHLLKYALGVVLKVTRATLDRLKLDELWLRCSSPQVLPRPA